MESAMDDKFNAYRPDLSIDDGYYNLHSRVYRISRDLEKWLNSGETLFGDEVNISVCFHDEDYCVILIDLNDYGKVRVSYCEDDISYRLEDGNGNVSEDIYIDEMESLLEGDISKEDIGMIDALLMGNVVTSVCNLVFGENSLEHKDIALTFWGYLCNNTFDEYLEKEAELGHLLGHWQGFE
jgi:hypothetical protein